MSLSAIEFISPETVIVKSEKIHSDAVGIEPNCEQTPTSGGRNSNSKCGEIFTWNNFDFLLICAYCGGDYSTFTDFGEHLRCEHRAVEDEADGSVAQDGLKFDGPKHEVGGEGDDTNWIGGDDEEKQAKCSSEKNAKDNKSYRVRVRKSSEQKFVCNSCQRTYRYKLSFERHKCPFASKPTNLSLQNDTVTSVKAEVDPISNDTVIIMNDSSDEINQIQNPEDQDTNNPDLFCEICSRQFKYKNVFRKHGMQHEQAPAALQKDPTYRKCIYCGQTFDNNPDWLAHENSHPKIGPFRCSHCLKKFKTESELEQHSKNHSEPEPVQCDQCGLNFSQPKNLASHINRVHLQLKPFSCELCDRKFVRKVELRVHMRRHTGERPYQCEECGRSFMIATLLNEHLKRHSNIRDVQCPVCPMAFFTKKMLRKHMVKHSTERPYVCPTCGNTFSRKKALLAHKKIHMDVKQYVCNLCGKAFAQHAGLYMHRKTHMNAVGS